MSLDKFIEYEMYGVHAVDGLTINAGIWNLAHEEHRKHRLLHYLAAHRPGIAYGLDVVAMGGQKVMITPGVAIDPEGRVIVLSERYALDITGVGQSHILINHRPVQDADTETALEGGGKVYYGRIEKHNVQVIRELPLTPHLELARISRTGADKIVREAANPFDPAADELNLLHRLISFPHCYADITIGEVGYNAAEGKTADGKAADWKPNRAGLWNLVREGNGHGFHLEFLGPAQLSGDRPFGAKRPPALLYMAGRAEFKPLEARQADNLLKLIQDGATLFAEACEGSAAFAESFKALAGKLGANLKPVREGHPLLTAHHVFPAVPAGRNPGGEILASEDGAVLLSTADYGGAWQGLIGGVRDAERMTAGRERVRQAQEFGLNVVAFAARRQRGFELDRMK